MLARPLAIPQWLFAGKSNPDVVTVKKESGNAANPASAGILEPHNSRPSLDGNSVKSNLISSAAKPIVNVQRRPHATAHAAQAKGSNGRSILGAN